MLDFINIAQAVEVIPEADGLIGTFGLSWKKFLGQLLNFGIVLFIFWKWVVGPIGRILQERQEKIERGLENAAAMEMEREMFEEGKLKEMKQVRIEAEKIIKDANETAEKIKSEALLTATRHSEKMVEQTKASLIAEKEKILQEARMNVAQLAIDISENILKSKLDPQKDGEIIEQSLNEAKKRYEIHH